MLSITSPVTHSTSSLQRYYGLVRLPRVLPRGSPKFLTELSRRAIPLDPAVCPRLCTVLYRRLLVSEDPTSSPHGWCNEA
jgi:hypothetical protein